MNLKGKGLVGQWWVFVELFKKNKVSNLGKYTVTREDPQTWTNKSFVEIRSLGPLEGQFLANSEFFRV